MTDFTAVDRRAAAIALQIPRQMDSAFANDYGLIRNRFGLTVYYKLRAYDLACVTPTPVVWINTEVSYGNAPAFPCGGPYSPIDILDTWSV